MNKEASILDTPGGMSDEMNRSTARQLNSSSSPANVVKYGIVSSTLSESDRASQSRNTRRWYFSSNALVSVNSGARSRTPSDRRCLATQTSRRNVLGSSSHAEIQLLR